MHMDILFIGSVVTTIVTLLGLAWRAHIFLTKIEKKLSEYDDNLKQNTRQMLRLTLLSEDIPITDRIKAGKKYINLGGNGYGELVYRRLLEELDNRDVKQI